MRRLKKSNGLLKACFVLFLAGIFISGCASVPKVDSAGFPYPVVKMGDVSYFSLIQLCEKEQISWDYDPLSQVLILQAPSKMVKILINSSKIMVGDAIKDLSAPIRLKESVVYAPLDLRYFLMGETCKLPAPVQAPSRFFLRPVDTIVLDAGHGGKDPGAISKSGLKEKDVVLDVVRGVKRELENCGVKVFLTRSGDEFIELGMRPRLANERKADIFVSIHANANRSRRIEGFEIYYLTENVDDSARALAAAENEPLELEGRSLFNEPLPLKALLWDLINTENRKESVELAGYVSRSVSSKLGMKVLGVKGAPFAVLKGARMPAVLVEIGYLSNSDGERKLRDPSYRARMAEAIALGILSFKNYAEK